MAARSIAFRIALPWNNRVAALAVDAEDEAVAPDEVLQRAVEEEEEEGAGRPGSVARKRLVVVPVEVMEEEALGG